MTERFRVRVRTAAPEAALNRCGELGLAFRDLRWEPDGQVSFTLSRRDWARLNTHSGGLDLSAAGGDSLRRWIRRRPALIVTLAVCAAALFLCSFFIWDFEITGSRTVPDETILRALERSGVGLGAFGLSIDGEDLRNHVLNDVPELSWITVNVSGCRAHVVVRERVPMPDMVDRQTPANVTARRSGLLLELYALDGAAAVLPGDTVEAGQLLISGMEDMDTEAGGTRVMPGRGVAKARTWYTLKTAVPLTAPVKRYTGTERTGWSLILGRRRFPLYPRRWLAGQADPVPYDTFTQRCQWRLFGIPLPVTAVRETVRYYEAVPAEQSAAAVLARTEAALRSQLDAAVLPYGEVRSARCASRQRGDVLEVTLSAECVEDIAVVTPIYTDSAPDSPELPFTSPNGL